MKPYRLDKTACSAQTVEGAANKYGYWKSRSYTERLKAAYYLNSVAYNFDINNPPRLDRTEFKTRHRS
jgi:hypothetical protein